MVLHKPALAYAETALGRPATSLGAPRSVRSSLNCGPVLSPEEIESDELLNERLLRKFGAKNHYSDWEALEAYDELSTEGVLPDLSHLD